jgi:hypothetical protein
MVNSAHFTLVSCRRAGHGSRVPAHRLALAGIRPAIEARTGDGGLSRQALIGVSVHFVPVIVRETGKIVAMEPIRTTKTARLRRLKMYREDLDQFVALFQGNCANVTVSDNKNRYDSLDEMKATIGPEVKNLDIRGESPSVHFLLNQKEIVQGSSVPAVFNELRSEEISDEADSLFLKIKDYLQQFERPNVRWPFLVVALIVFTGAILSLARRTLPSNNPPWTELICVVVALIAFVLAIKVDNLIVLDRRVDSPSFLVRNRDAFATHAVTATISALIGAIIGWFFGHFLK